VPAWIAIGSAATISLSGMTVADLQKQLAGGEKVTVIDVRSPSLFARGHVPGAINIPASLCPQKKLPPLGKVVICGEGLGRDATDNAAAALAAKPGITVEILVGGFAAWENEHSPTTRTRGLEPEALNYITYAQLKAAKVDDLVLIDLRKNPLQQRESVTGSAAPASQPLTDLNQEFPGARLAKSAFDLAQSRQNQAGGSASPPLFVLIDSGDGTAQAMARTLKANGMNRYAILAGGELILARHGQAGLQRGSSGSRLLNQNPASTGTNN
jgi:rhodanese-related sulfurtransferase